MCECAASKSFVERENEEKIMQFLMGLNDSYDHVKNQILIMDPSPTVNKAYSMVLRVEKRRQVNVFSTEVDTNVSAFLASSQSNNNRFKSF